MDLNDTEIKFAKQLAANEKKIRDKSLKKLKKYLQLKSKKNGFTHEDFLRIWKGLHYCMWMQDKPLIQEELCTKISQLVHDVTNNELKWLFIRVFIETEVREWEGIDVWRVDKFMMLFRSMLTEALTALKNQNWKSKSVEGLLQVYTETMWNVSADIPYGLRSHFMDIYIHELNKVAGDKINGKQFLQFIEPCVRLMQEDKDVDGELTKKVIQLIFNPIIERAIQLHALKDKKKRNKVPFPRLKIDTKMLADYLFDVGKSDAVMSRQRAVFYQLVQRLQDASDGVQPTGPERVVKRALPRKLVGEAISSLLEMETEISTKPSKQELKALKKSKGKENTSDNITEISMSMLEDGVKVVNGKRKHTDDDGDDESNEEPVMKAKRKAMNEINFMAVDDEEEIDEQNIGDDNDNDDSSSEDENENETAISSKKKQKKKKEKFKGLEKKSTKKNKKLVNKKVKSGNTESASVSLDVEKEKDSGDNSKEMANGIKQTGKGKQDKTPGKLMKTPQAKSKTKSEKKGKLEEAKKTDDEKHISDESLTETTGKGIAKKTGNDTKSAKKRKISVVDGVNDIDHDESEQGNEKSDKKKLTKTDQVDGCDANTHSNVKGSVIQIKPSKDLEDGEVEIFIPSKKYKSMVSMSPATKFAEFENKKTPIAFVKRALAKTSKSATPGYIKKKIGTSAPNSATTGSAKKVSFNMKKNQRQSFMDSLKSPIVPFNPSKTPEQSILKVNSEQTSAKSGSVLRSGVRKRTAETPPSTGSLKTLKTPKRTTYTKSVPVKAPVANLQVKFKRKTAADFFAL